MKSRKTIYVLLPLVLLIWAVIGWKVYAAVHGNDEMNNSALPMKKIELQQTTLPDTFQLVADYRDPFLDKVVQPVTKVKTDAVKKTQVASPAPVAVLKWPLVIYYGLVKRSGEEKALGFLRVDGESFFVRGAEQAGAVKVGRLWKDSVEVIFGKKKKVMRK